MTLLSCLIKPPLLGSHAKVTDAELSGVPRLVKIERAGDVLHVFSHIRKTYRVQWVVLEGGGTSPPELAKRPSLASSTKQKKVAGPPKVVSIWTPLDGVEETSIGTGVLKVWSRARSLWEGKR